MDEKEKFNLLIEQIKEDLLNAQEKLIYYSSLSCESVVENFKDYKDIYSILNYIIYCIKNTTNEIDEILVKVNNAINDNEN